VLMFQNRGTVAMLVHVSTCASVPACWHESCALLPWLHEVLTSLTLLSVQCTWAVQVAL
jgi:hypothetical protein